MFGAATQIVHGADELVRTVVNRTEAREVKFLFLTWRLILLGLVHRTRCHLFKLGDRCFKCRVDIFDGTEMKWWLVAGLICLLEARAVQPRRLGGPFDGVARAST